MQKNKKTILVSVLLLLVISQLSFVNVQVKCVSWPMEPSANIYKQYVYDVVNDSFVDAVKQVPEINIVRLSHIVLTGRIALQLVHKPIKSPRYDYRLFICWDKQINLKSIGIWPNLDWDNVIPPNTNLTICITGGSSWFGVTNGSYSAFYNSMDELVYNESKSNSVTIVDEALEFPIKQDYITDRYFVESAFAVS